MSKEENNKQEDVEEFEDEKFEDGGFNWWIVIAIIVGIGLVTSIFTGGFTTAGHKSDAELKAQVTDFINQNFLQGQDVNLSIIDMKNLNKMGLYEIDVSIDAGPAQKLYATADGQLLFLQAVPMNDIMQQPQTPAQNIEMPKSDKPEVNLYVMSYCPYGVLAEKNFIPALKLFGDQIDFNLRFIARETSNGFDSLHGESEVAEDMRQVCVMDKYPDTYLDYIMCQADNFQARKDPSTTYEDCLTANSMSIEDIDACVKTEGPQLFKENIAYANQKGIGGSPTYEINGVTKVGADATETFKQKVCSAFNVAPEVCGQTLDTTSEAATGNC